MPSFKEPSFQDRAALAAKAKEAALAKLRAKPPVDEAVAAARREAEAARAAALKEASEAKRLAREAEKAAKLERKEAEAAALAAKSPVLTEEEKAAARAAKYAARKSRVGKR